jgi:hypothetical protein
MSSVERLTPADAAAFWSRCSTEDMPGMAMMTGDLLNSQTKARPAEVTPSLAAMAFSSSDAASLPILSG